MKEEYIYEIGGIKYRLSKIPAFKKYFDESGRKIQVSPSEIPDYHEYFNEDGSEKQNPYTDSLGGTKKGSPYDAESKWINRASDIQLLTMNYEEFAKWAKSLERFRIKMASSITS